MNLFFIILAGLLLLERIWKYWVIKRFFREAGSVNYEGEPVQITILQPILSGDPTLWSCLAHNLTQASRHYLEFLWLIDSDDRVAQVGCQELVTRHPQTTVQLLTLPPPPDGVNPKMFKLIAGLERAQGNVIAVLDDDTMLPDNGLDHCLSALDQPDVGLAFGLPYYTNFSNVWSSLVSCFVNGHSLLTYIPYLSFIDPFTINGMFYLLKRQTLADIGGFAGLERAVTDDFAVAQRVRQHGYHLAQTPLRHGISTQVGDATHYGRLLKRWFVFPQISIMPSAGLRVLIIFYSLVVIPTFFPLLVVVIAILSSSIYALIGAFLYIGVNLFMMYDFNRNYLYAATPSNRLIWAVVIQILLPLHIGWALLRPGQINWRGHILDIHKDGGFHFVQRRSSSDSG